MNQEIDISPLFDLTNLQPRPYPGKIILTDRMEPPEEDPKTDWLYPGILTFIDLSNERSSEIKTAACIGTGQGIDAIVLSHLFRLNKLYVTDIVEELLEDARKNIEDNIPLQFRPKHTIYVDGRDCEPLEDKVDLIFFSPPPLMIEETSKLSEGIARTTLIERGTYSKLANSPTDIKLKWSTLPLYGFLLSAKEKLTPDGSIVVLYSGRIPFEAIQPAFNDAGFNLRVRYQALKFQTDPQYLKEYAEYEKRHLDGDTFDFYNPKKAEPLLKKAGIEFPGIVNGHDDRSLKYLLKEARISADEAYRLTLDGNRVLHIGYSLEGTLKKS